LIACRGGSIKPRVIQGEIRGVDAPLVPLPDVVLLAHVYEVRDGFSGKEHQTVDDFNLKRKLSQL